MNNANTEVRRIGPAIRPHYVDEYGVSGPTMWYDSTTCTKGDPASSRYLPSRLWHPLVPQGRSGHCICSLFFPDDKLTGVAQVLIMYGGLAKEDEPLNDVLIGICEENRNVNWKPLPTISPAPGSFGGVMGVLEDAVVMKQPAGDGGLDNRVTRRVILRRIFVHGGQQEVNISNDLTTLLLPKDIVREHQSDFRNAVARPCRWHRARFVSQSVSAQYMHRWGHSLVPLTAIHTRSERMSSGRELSGGARLALREALYQAFRIPLQLSPIYRLTGENGCVLPRDTGWSEEHFALVTIIERILLPECSAHELFAMFGGMSSMSRAHNEMSIIFRHRPLPEMTSVRRDIRNELNWSQKKFQRVLRQYGFDGRDALTDDDVLAVLRQHDGSADEETVLLEFVVEARETWHWEVVHAERSLRDDRSSRGENVDDDGSDDTADVLFDEFDDANEEDFTEGNNNEEDDSASQANRSAASNHDDSSEAESQKSAPTPHVCVDAEKPRDFFESEGRDALGPCLGVPAAIPPYRTSKGGGTESTIASCSDFLWVNPRESMSVTQTARGTRQFEPRGSSGSGSSCIPSGRRRQSCALWGDDIIVMFGGRNIREFFGRELWFYSLSLNCWTNCASGSPRALLHLVVHHRLLCDSSTTLHQPAAIDSATVATSEILTDFCSCVLGSKGSSSLTEEVTEDHHREPDEWAKLYRNAISVQAARREAMDALIAINASWCIRQRSLKYHVEPSKIQNYPLSLDINNSTPGSISCPLAHAPSRPLVNSLVGLDSSRPENFLQYAVDPALVMNDGAPKERTGQCLIITGPVVVVGDEDNLRWTVERGTGTLVHALQWGDVLISSGFNSPSLVSDYGLLSEHASAANPRTSKMFNDVELFDMSTFRWSCLRPQFDEGPAEVSTDQRAPNGSVKSASKAMRDRLRHQQEDRLPMPTSDSQPPQSSFSDQERAAADMELLCGADMGTSLCPELRGLWNAGYVDRRVLQHILAPILTRTPWSTRATFEIHRNGPQGRSMGSTTPVWTPGELRATTCSSNTFSSSRSVIDVFGGRGDIHAVSSIHRMTLVHRRTSATHGRWYPGCDSAGSLKEQCVVWLLMEAPCADGMKVMSERMWGAQHIVNGAKHDQGGTLPYFIRRPRPGLFVMPPPPSSNSGGAATDAPPTGDTPHLRESLWRQITRNSRQQQHGASRGDDTAAVTTTRTTAAAELSRCRPGIINWLLMRADDAAVALCCEGLFSPSAIASTKMPPLGESTARLALEIFLGIPLRAHQPPEPFRGTWDQLTGVRRLLAVAAYLRFRPGAERRDSLFALLVGHPLPDNFGTGYGDRDKESLLTTLDRVQSECERVLNQSQVDGAPWRWVSQEGYWALRQRAATASPAANPDGSLLTWDPKLGLLQASFVACGAAPLWLWLSRPVPSNLARNIVEVLKGSEEGMLAQVHRVAALRLLRLIESLPTESSSFPDTFQEQEAARLFSRLWGEDDLSGPCPGTGLSTGALLESDDEEALNLLEEYAYRFRRMTSSIPGAATTRRLGHR